MATIENTTTNGINIYLGAIHNILFVPGYNLNVDEAVVESIKAHPYCVEFFQKGYLIEVGKDIESEAKLDDRTNMLYVERQEEFVPVINPIVNNVKTPIINNGASFTVPELREVGLTATMAQKIARLTPPEGWTSSEHLISALNLSGTVADNIQKLW